MCATGLLWYQRPGTAIGIREELGLIFFMCLFWGLVPMLTTIITFTENRKVVRKELEDGVYHVSAYYVSRTLLYLPFEVLPPTVFCFIVYWMAGLNPWFGRFVLFTIVLILETLVASSWGFFIGAVSSTVYQAIGTATIVQLLSIMVVHFLTLDPPAWIAWSQYLSFSAYAYRVCTACPLLLPCLPCLPGYSSFVLTVPAWLLPLSEVPSPGSIAGLHQLPHAAFPGLTSCSSCQGSTSQAWTRAPKLGRPPTTGACTRMGTSWWRRPGNCRTCQGAAG